MKRMLTALLWTTLGIILVLALLPPFVLSSHLPTVSQYSSRSFRHITANGLRFVGGHYSLADAYQHQDGWPGRMAWGGIYPAALTVWKMLPRNTPIWSLHTHTYCMLPDCRMEGYMSYRFSRHMTDIYYGRPEQAKKWLQSENHNYFFIANSLPMTDPLPRTPLFSPENISKYLGIVWTDGNSTLLT